MTCAHCDQPIRGYGTDTDHNPLCHPSIGMDCYHLVTLYQHPLHCTQPGCAASVAARLARAQNRVIID